MGWAIAIQGGAGDIPVTLPANLRQAREEALQHCLDLGVNALKAGKSAMDVVEFVVRELENIPIYNCGRGSILTTEGTVEMEASIMDGTTLHCGAVCGLKTVVNPISLARLVMEKTRHIFFGFEGAEAFAREQGVETADPSYFITQENIERLEKLRQAYEAQIDHVPISSGDSQGTVGCVVSDRLGNLASATSTGGHTYKMAGRIGDTPIVGAGTYADGLCAVSATGTGEVIIRHTVARDVAALMEFKGLSLNEAAEYVVERAPVGSVGLVAVSATGDVAMPFNTTGMFRACAMEDGHSEIGIWR